MQTSIMELQGIALDWAVTQIDDQEALRYGITEWRQQRCTKVVRGEYAYRYHQSWNQSQQLIKSMRICMGYDDAGQAVAWQGCVSDYDLVPMFYGENTLIAALRCICFLRYGDTLDIPEELQ